MTDLPAHPLPWEVECGHTDTVLMRDNDCFRCPHHGDLGGNYKHRCCWQDPSCPGYITDPDKLRAQLELNEAAKMVASCPPITEGNAYDARAEDRVWRYGYNTASNARAALMRQALSTLYGEEAK